VCRENTLRLLSKAVLLGLLSVLSTLIPLGFASPTSGGTFQFLIGTGPLCSIPGVTNACPDVSMADNGDTVAVAGQGTLSVHAKSVTGSGTFVHKAPDGSVKAMGTWSALQLVSFKSFGNSSGLPSNFVGGLALILVQLSVGGTPVHTAVLTVICDVGSPPTGLMEGIKLAVQDTPFNFNKQVSGITLFIVSA
jgi:hypothetical protein